MSSSAPTSPRMRGLPLHLPDDLNCITDAVNALVAAGYFPWRPDLHQLKVGPYNYYPTSGKFTRDGAARQFQGYGMKNFLTVLRSSYVDLKKPDIIIRPLLEFGLDDDPVATSPLPLAERRFIEKLQGALADDLPPWEQTPPNPFADAFEHLARASPATPSGRYDTALSELSPHIARALKELALGGAIDCEVISGEVWVRHHDLVHYTSHQEDTPA